MKHTITGHVYWQLNRYMKEPRILFDMYDRRQWPEDSKDGCVWVREHTVTVDVPDDFDPRPAQIASLEEEKRRVKAEFAAKVTEIDSRINKLLALEMA